MKNPNDLLQTPCISFSVYEALPSFLKEITDRIEDPREKDMTLLSCLVVQSGCFSHLKGSYRSDDVYPNLFCFIVAPPASGKSIMKYPIHLADEIQKKLKRENQKRKIKYELELKVWKRNYKQGENPPPEKPKYPVLIIPGNATSAAIHKLLADNDGIGVLCETEADTLSSAINQQWGEFSDLLRRTFQHERIARTRSKDDEYTIIDLPRVSVLLSGTSNQVPKLINSVEDGLASRFMYYCYERDPKWQNPQPKESIRDLKGFYNKLSLSVYEAYATLAEGQHAFHFSVEQYSKMEPIFSRKLEYVNKFGSASAQAFVFRLGLISYRIAMVLSVIRNMSNLREHQILECSDPDFDISMQLVDILFEHSMVMYSMLPNKSENLVKVMVQRFYNRLPSEMFQREEANEVGYSLGISVKSVHNYLERLIKVGLIVKFGHGVYQKNLSSEGNKANWQVW